MEGHVQSAAWSPCGTKVIFADSVPPTCYFILGDRVSPLGEKKYTCIEGICYSLTDHVLIAS